MALIKWISFFSCLKAGLRTYNLLRKVDTLGGTSRSFNSDFNGGMGMGRSAGGSDMDGAGDDDGDGTGTGTPAFALRNGGGGGGARFTRTVKSDEEEDVRM